MKNFFKISFSYLIDVTQEDSMDASEKIMYFLVIIKAVHFRSSWWDAAKSVGMVMGGLVFL